MFLSSRVVASSDLHLRNIWRTHKEQKKKWFLKIKFSCDWMKKCCIMKRCCAVFSCYALGCSINKFHSCNVSSNINERECRLDVQTPLSEIRVNEIEQFFVQVTRSIENSNLFFYLCLVLLTMFMQVKNINSDSVY